MSFAPFGIEDVEFHAIAPEARLQGALGLPGPVRLVPNTIIPVAVVGDQGRDNEIHAEIFTASAVVGSIAGLGTVFEFHHPLETVNLLPQLWGTLFALGTGGGIPGAIKSIIQSSGTNISRLAVVLDVTLSVVAITNPGPGAWGGAAWIATSFGASPILIDTLPTPITVGTSILGTPNTRCRFWAGRRSGGRGLDIQNVNPVFGSPGAIGLVAPNTGAQVFRPFERVTPFYVLPGRGFALGFPSIIGSQTNANIAASVTWREVAINL